MAKAQTRIIIKKGCKTQISFYGLAITNGSHTRTRLWKCFMSCTWVRVQIRWSADKKVRGAVARVSSCHWAPIWFSAGFYRFQVPRNQIAHPEIRTTARLKLSAAPSLPLTGHIFHILFMLTPLSHCLLWGFICPKGGVWPAATMITASPCKPDTAWTTIRLVFVSTVLRDDKAVY